MRRFNKILSIALLAIVLAFSTVAFTACKTAPTNQPVDYTVTFETDGGTVYDVVKVTNSTQVVELPTPEKFGCTFLGWYDNAEFNGNALEVYYRPTASVTLYAKWESHSYVLTLVSNGGTEYKPVATNGQKIMLPTPEKFESEFAGWYDNAEFTGEAYVGEITLDANLTLYAKWIEEEFIEVSFETFGGTTHETIRMEGEDIQLPTPIKYGYAFKGWYDNEEYDGNPILGMYNTNKDVTLFAKWSQVTYLYKYLNGTTDYVREAYEPGTEINVKLMAKPEPAIVDGIECPFVKWVYDGDTEVDLPDTITLGEDHVYIVAVYDYSNLPAKENVEVLEDGSVKTTGKAIKVLLDEGKNVGAYSLDITFRKGSSTGAANIAFRMKHSGADYAYEDPGTYYIAIGIGPSSGIVQISRVLNGGWGRLVGNMELSSLPEGYQKKFNEAEDSEKLTFNMLVMDYGTSFVLYIDNEYVMTYSDASVLAQYTGTGIGFRSSVTGSIYSNVQYAEFKTVNVDTNGGTVIDPVKYGLGKLQIEEPTKDNMVFVGWFYDKECTEAIDLYNPVVTDGMTVYAGYRDARYVVTLMDKGQEFRKLGYEEGSINLPDPGDKANQIFTGWYYDADCTQLVNEDAPIITDNVTLYAGYRFPAIYVNDLGNGQYKVTKKTAGSFGIINHPYYQYDMNVSFEKGVSGAGGIAFRMDVYADYSYETIGMNYIAVGVDSKSGTMQTSSVINGAWTRLISNTALTGLPVNFQNKFNATATGETFSYLMTIKDYGTYYEVYFDNEFIYTYNGAALTETFTGNGYGLRSSTEGLTYSYTIKELCVPVSYETNGGNEIEAVHFLKGVTELPTPNKANNVFTGWYYDAGLTQIVKEEEFNPTQATVLYAGWMEYDYIVTLDVNGGNALANDTVYYAEGVEMELPTPTNNAKLVKENKNVVTYIFDGWFLGETKITATSTITSNCTLVAKWSTKETRNGVVVNYNEDGSIYYTDTGLRSGNTGSQGWDLAINDFTQSSVWETSFTLNVNSYNLSSAPEIRIFFLANPMGYITHADGLLRVDGTGKQAIPFLNLYPTSGRINYGAKITGTSAQPVQGALDTFAGSNYYDYFKSIKTGDKVSYDFRIVNGIKEDGSVWFKVYLMGSLIYTYGLDVDAGTTKVVDGEQVYGQVLTTNSVKSHTKLQSYLNGTLDGAPIAGSVGLWYWDNLDALGGISVTNISEKPVYEVSYEVDGEIVKQGSYVEGAEIDYTIGNTDIIGTDAVAYYNKFVGWQNAQGQAVTTVTGNMVLTPIYEKVNVYKVTVNADNGTEVTSKYYEAGQKLQLPEDPVKNGYEQDGVQYGYVFDAWYVGADVVNAEYVISGAVEVVAKYTESIAYTVNYVTGFADCVVQSAIVAAGEDLTLPEDPSHDGYSFYGWYTDEACQNAYVVGAVNSSFTLYAKWVVWVEVTFMNGEEEVTSLTTDAGTALAQLPNANKANEFKANGNMISYTLEGWYLNGEKISLETKFDQSQTVYAKFNAKETRNGVVVTYDEAGNPTYVENTYRVGANGASVEGYDFVEYTSDFTKANAYEVGFTVTVAKKSTTSTELRLMFLTNPEPYLTNNGAGHLEVDGTNNYTVWIDIYLHSGRINLGSKITGSSFQPKGKAIEEFVGTKWNELYTGTAVGSPMTFDFKVQQGVYADGSAWFKVYILGDLLFTYGLEADAGTTDMVSGEKVYGYITTPATYATTNYGRMKHYLAGDYSTVGGTIGAWTWANIPNTVGSITYSNFTSKTINVNTQTNDGTAVTDAFVSNGKLYAEIPYKAGNVFNGWYYDAELTQPVDVNNFDATKGDIIYAGWTATTYTVTLMAMGKEVGKTGYTQGALQLPNMTQQSNVVATAWYYDEALTQVVDLANPVITADTTLYSDARYYNHNKFIDNGNGNYGIGDASALKVIGEMAGMVEHTMTLNFKKKGGGGCGIAFRMNVYADNSYENCQYLTVDIYPNDGSLQIATINYNFVHLEGNPAGKPVALANLPKAWQDKYNAAADQEEITCVLTVKDYGTYFQAYIDGDLAYTSTKDISMYKGIGYGVRSSTKNITFTYQVSQLTVGEEA